MELLKTLAEHQQLIPLVEKVSVLLVTTQARLGSPPVHCFEHEWR